MPAPARSPGLCFGRIPLPASPSKNREVTAITPIQLSLRPNLLTQSCLSFRRFLPAIPEHPDYRGQSSTLPSSTLLREGEKSLLKYKLAPPLLRAPSQKRRHSGHPKALNIHKTPCQSTLSILLSPTALLLSLSHAQLSLSFTHSHPVSQLLSNLASYLSSFWSNNSSVLISAFPSQFTPPPIVDPTVPRLSLCSTTHLEEVQLCLISGHNHHGIRHWLSREQRHK